MSKVAEIYFDNQSWGFPFFETQKKVEEIKKNDWGDRSHLEHIGKKINEMVWHTKPKRIFSSKSQMELYFGWLNQVTDQRTRRIIAASLIDYYVPVGEEEYQQIKDKKMIQFDTMHSLEFDVFSIPSDHPFQLGAMFSDDPIENYQFWIVEGDEEQRKFANEYGVIKEIQIPTVKKTTMSHRFYTLKLAMKYITKDFNGKEDSYFNTSMTYQKPSKKDYRRLGERVTEYCLLFSEIDFYKIDEYKDKSKKEMLVLIFQELDKYGFPRPTEVVHSRGLHLAWKISPIPAYRFEEWKMLQVKIHSILAKFGADQQTITDKVRLLRLVGTVHSKTGEKIWGQSFTEDRYLFNELMELFCAEELEKEQQKREKNREKYLNQLEKRFEVVEGGNRVLKQTVKDKPLQDSHYVGNIIHEKYRRDLLHLVHLRGGVMDGYREFACFLLRYWTLCITDGKTVKAINEMEKLYYSMNINGDYSLQEIISYTTSAETAFKKWKENWRKGYNYKNDTLVAFLGVTKEEQSSMWILMDDEETKRREQVRDTAKKQKKRADKHVSNDLLRETIMAVTEGNPEMKSYKIAEIVKEKLGKCSKNTVEKVWAEMAK